MAQHGRTSADRRVFLQGGATKMSMTYNFSDSEFEPPKQKSAAEDRNSFDWTTTASRTVGTLLLIDCDKANDVHALVGRRSSH
jgi:hypothetical protein